MERVAAWWAALTDGGVRSVLAVDGLFALVLGGLAGQGSWSAAAERGLRLDFAGFALVGVATAALAVRRLWPLAALGTSFGATLLFLALGYPYSPILQLVSVAMYSAAAWCSERVSLTALVVLVGTYVPVAWWRGGTPWPEFGVVPLAAVWLVLPLAVGVAVRAYRRVKARAAQAERRSYIYEERLRIAQEVHDVVGHSLAVINMQAGVALHVLENRPTRAAEALRAMRQTSAAALEDLRTALAPLSVIGSGMGRRPAPRLAEVTELVEAVNRAGLRVDLVVEGGAGDGADGGGHCWLSDRAGVVDQCGPARRGGTGDGPDGLRPGRGVADGR
ncbi:histidine kinase dimerization/phosphoacceptor domain-containing protein [Micromonosporaceae bacterium B7E4]